MAPPPDEAWLRASSTPILGALELLHGAGVFHRDISPDNILLLPDGRPVLLDFGSARRVIGRQPAIADRACSSPSSRRSSSTPTSGGMRQGPWTDLYALGATLHFVLTGARRRRR